MKYLIVLLMPVACYSQNSVSISTSDVANFWNAFDKLSIANSREDSCMIIQKDYLDKGTPAFKKIIKLRRFTADEYVKRIRLYPNFWTSVRPLTTRLDADSAEIGNVLNNLSAHIPGFRYPDIYFIISPMRMGGTTSGNALLIGAELAAPDSTVITTELNEWHNHIVGHLGGTAAVIAHEAIHVQQTGIPFLEIFNLVKHRRLSLLTMSILEGSADFLTATFLHLNMNRTMHTHAMRNECAIWKEFKQAIENEPYDYTNWLYSGPTSGNGQADLGYFIGYRITEAYYHNCTDKKKAIKTILKRGRYKHIYKRSHYQYMRCN